MQSITSCRRFIVAPPRNVRWVALCWMVGSTILSMGGCVSQQTYETAKHEAQARANELAQTQAEIQTLEQQRDAMHAANQRDERTLSSLKSELQKLKSSFDQTRKTNQVKLASLEHNIAALRARHQAMLKEIAETKRYEKKLEALTAQHERELETMPGGPEAHVTTVDGLPQEPHLVAVITPQSPQPGGTSSLSTPAQAPSQLEAPSAIDANSAAPSPLATAAAVTAPTPSNTIAKKGPVSVTGASPTTSTPPAPQNESWFSNMTGWLTSMFDWIWS
jgi:hypothetical protein